MSRPAKKLRSSSLVHHNVVHCIPLPALDSLSLHYLALQSDHLVFRTPTSLSFSNTAHINIAHRGGSISEIRGAGPLGS